MSDTVIVAVLALCGTAVGSIGGILAANKLTNFRLQKLEEKVEAHNKLVVRMVEVEQKSQRNSERIDAIEHKLDTKD